MPYTTEMATTHVTLENLPVETTKRIVSFLPCESALCLMKVNRRMYMICNDELVFKAIISNRNGKHYISEESDSAVSPWSLPTALSLSSKFPAASTWARFALADSRARDLLSQLVSTDGMASIRGKTDDLALWLPQIVAFHHPMLTEMNIPNLFIAFDYKETRHRRSLTEEILTFSVSIAILQQGISSSEEGPMYGGLNIIRLKKMHDARPGNYRFLPIVFAWAIQDFCQRTKYQPGMITPPLPERIPFSILMDLPLPFSPIPSFEATFLSKMMSPRFLEDGEWVGYYSLSMDLGLSQGRRRRLIQGNVDPPMQGIRFSASTVDQGKIFLTSPGFDRVGTFVLDGTVNADGSAHLMKTYAAGFSWKWNAVMTPVGFVGVWGTEGPHGHIWLWKREWCGTNSPPA